MAESQEKPTLDKKVDSALPPNISQFKQIFLDVAKKNKEDFTLLMSLGLWNLTQGFYNEAINDFQAVLDRLNSSEEKMGIDFKQFALGQAHHMIAYCKMMKDKTNEKEKEESLDALIQSIMQSIERASQADARQIGLWNTAALALILKANDFQQALGVFESLINKVPNYLDALNNYGVCLMHKDKLEEAALCFNTVLNSNNDHIEALNNLSIILSRWNNFEDAIFMANRAYEIASALKKNEVENMCHDLEDNEDSSLSSTLLFIANNLCCFNLQIGDTNAVTKITEDVASLLNSSFYQNHPLVDYNVSKLFLRTGNPTAYQSTVTKAIDLQPDEGMLWAALAEGFEAQRDIHFSEEETMQEFNNKAIATFEQAIQSSPNDPLIWNQTGVFYMRQGHYNSAKEAFETAIQLNPHNLNAWSNLALATHLEGTTELEKVEQLYRKALEIDPRSVDAMMNFSTLYRQHKKYDKAAELLRHCESLDPNNVLVLNNFGLLYQSLGDVQQACRYFDRAQQVDPTFEPAKTNREKLSFKPN